jgi:hypothetical protein
MVLQGKDARIHMNIAAGRGTKGVLGGRSKDARVWLGRPAHVVRCLALFDDPARARHAHASGVTAFTRFELYVCWAGTSSWGAGTIEHGQIDGGDAVCAAGARSCEGAAAKSDDSDNEAAWDQQCRESFEEAGGWSV